MKLPIRVRLALIYSLILVAVVGAIELGGYLSVRAAIHAITDRELQTRLAGIEDHLARHMNVIPWPELRIAVEARPAFQGPLLAIRDGSGRFILRGERMSGIALGAAGSVRIVNDSGSGLRVLAARRTILGRPYDLFLGTDLRTASSILNRLWLAILISLPPVILICGAAAYWASARALQPIQEIVSVARAIDSRHLSARVPVPGSRDEVQQLAETFNGMLGRIDTGVRQMRDFTANASHELRTPVAVMRAAAEVALLRQDAESGYYREALDRILRESERATQLIEAMLELARADRGLDRVAKDRVDLNESVQEACQKVAVLASKRSLVLRFVRSDTPCGANGSRDALTRLWLILLDNAIKYTPPGGSVSVCVISAESGPVVEVADTGIGIAAEHRDRIFERFYRVDKARSRGAGGAGLGLAIAREIASAHQASIQVESAPGEGSRFFVTFPQLASEAPATAGVVRAFS